MITELRFDHVAQLIADQRLGVVDQVGDQHPGAGHTGRHRPVVLIHHLDDKQVLAQLQAGVLRRAGAEHERLGGRIDAGRLEAPGLADAAPHVRGQRLCAVGAEARPNTQPPGELFARELPGDGRIADQALGLISVERIDQLRQRGGDGQARRGRPGRLQVGKQLPGDGHRAGRTDGHQPCAGPGTRTAERAQARGGPNSEFPQGMHEHAAHPGTARSAGHPVLAQHRL